MRDANGDLGSGNRSSSLLRGSTISYRRKRWAFATGSLRPRSLATLSRLRRTRRRKRRRRRRELRRRPGRRWRRRRHPGHGLPLSSLFIAPALPIACSPRDPPPLPPKAVGRPPPLRGGSSSGRSRRRRQRSTSGRSSHGGWGR